MALYMELSARRCNFGHYSSLYIAFLLTFSKIIALYESDTSLKNKRKIL